MCIRDSRRLERRQARTRGHRGQGRLPRPARRGRVPAGRWPAAVDVLHRRGHDPGAPRARAVRPDHASRPARVPPARHPDGRRGPELRRLIAMYDIGRSRRASKAFSFDEIALVPSRRTRGIEEVNLAWRIDAIRLDFPIVAAPMDSVMSPATAIAMGQLGGLGVLNLEGLWTRYADPAPIFDELAAIEDQVSATKRMQELYAAPIQPELIEARMAEIRAAGVPVAGSLSPQNTREFADVVVKAAPDFFVIRGTTVSAEHVSKDTDPLDLKTFIRTLDVPVIVGGCATYQTGLHLMRTGAAGVLVGFGGGARHANRDVLGIEVPMASCLLYTSDAADDLTRVA